VKLDQVSTDAGSYFSILESLGIAQAIFGPVMQETVARLSTGSSSRFARQLRVGRKSLTQRRRGAKRILLKRGSALRLCVRKIFGQGQFESLCTTSICMEKISHAKAQRRRVNPDGFFAALRLCVKCFNRY